MLSGDKGNGSWDVIAAVIKRANAHRILEVGCGGGRLFPLYRQLGIDEIVGQDISSQAIRMAAERSCDANVHLTQCPIPQLNYAARCFDLAVSNRTLQHIPPEQIEEVIAALCRLCKGMYINELSGSDDAPPTPVMYIHDYKRMFADHGFEVTRSGTMSKQTWIVFMAPDTGKEVLRSSERVLESGYR